MLCKWCCGNSNLPFKVGECRDDKTNADYEEAMNTIMCVCVCVCVCVCGVCVCVCMLYVCARDRVCVYVWCYGAI